MMPAQACFPGEYITMQFFSKVFSAETSSSYTLNTACFSVTINPLDRGNYHSAVEVGELGRLTLALVQNRSAIVMRSGETAPSPAERRCSIIYVVEGEMLISHQHGTTAMKQGQFILLDNAHARKMFIYKSVTLLLVCTPLLVLQRFLPDVDKVLGQALMEQPAGGKQSPFLAMLSLWQHLKQGALEEFSSNIGEDILNDMAGMFVQHSLRRTRSRHSLQLISRIRQYIESQLADPALSAEAIASEFKVSSRYLRALFQDSEGLCQYIQRRRVEESARLLSSPQHQHSSITDIAYRCGFNSSTHFARCFKAHFNENARVFRRRHLQMHDHMQEPLAGQLATQH
jgi:AraC family transcriptional activator of tynA and feaB